MFRFGILGGFSHQSKLGQKNIKSWCYRLPKWFALAGMQNLGCFDELKGFIFSI